MFKFDLHQPIQLFITYPLILIWGWRRRIKVPIKIALKVNDEFTKVMAVSLAKPNNLI